MTTSNARYALPLLLALTTAVLSAAGPETKYRAPRTEDGRPDLSGVWNFSSDVPLERPLAFGDKKFFSREDLAKQRAAKANALNTVGKLVPIEDVGLNWLDYTARIENLRSSLIVYPENGRLPALVEGVFRVPGPDEILLALNELKNGPPPAALLSFLAEGRHDGPEDFNASERCLGGSGTPLTPDFDNNYLQVIQAKDTVVFRTEPLHHAKIVPLDGRPHVSDRLRSWTGDSRGHWDGEALVVETRNFNSRTRSFAGAGTSSDKVVTERFTRVAANAIEYEATIVDPKTFQDKVVVSYPLAKVDAQVYESACHEGNYSLRNILAGARKSEQDAASRP